MFENQSVLVFQTNNVYELGEYELHSSYLYVCPPYEINRGYNSSSGQIRMKYDRIQGVLSIVGVVISLIALLLLFIVYVTFPTLRNLPGKCILGLIAALFVGQLLFLFMSPSDDGTFPGPLCFHIAVCIHYCFLAVFFWTNVLAFDLCLTFSSGRTKTGSSKRYCFYSTYAWLGPALIVSTSLALDILERDDLHRPRYGDGICWISSGSALLIFFVIPVGIILASNIILFFITVHHIRLSARASKIIHQKSKSMKRLLLHVKLSTILGFAWLFGFIALLTDWTVLWYVFTIFNSLQGAFLFVTFVFTRKVLRLLKSKWQSTTIHDSSKTTNIPSSAQPKYSSDLNKSLFTTETNL